MASDGREWGRYDEALVRRGELLLDFSVVDEWKRELEGANDGKVGGPYRYPEAFMRLLGFIRSLPSPLQADRRLYQGPGEAC